MTAAPAFAVVEVEGFVAVDVRSLLVVAMNIKKKRMKLHKNLKNNKLRLEYFYQFT